MPRLRKRRCIFCGADMYLEGNRWTCSRCTWMMPNAEICPRCWARMPEEAGEDGEKICPECGYELWPPRDGELWPPPKEVWYCPPGGTPYKVGEGRPVNPPVAVPKRGGGRSRKSRHKSPLQRRWENWKRNNPMRPRE